MLPFLELEIIISNIDKQQKPVTSRIQPQEIEYYYPGFHEGTVIVMKSQHSYITLTPIDQFDHMLSGYYEAVKANPGVFGNLKLTPKPKLHATS